MPSLRIPLLFLVAGLTLAAPAPSQARGSQHDQSDQSKRYIVVYDTAVASRRVSGNVESARLEAQLRFTSEFRYHHALSGFRRASPNRKPRSCVVILSWPWL